MPIDVDSSKQFYIYKSGDVSDITFDFFKHYNNITTDFTNPNNVSMLWNEQFYNYKIIDYDSKKCFIKKYFTPSLKIETISKNLLEKYSIDTKNTIAVYYRGTNKIEEINSGQFEDYYLKLKNIIRNKNMSILLQTDSAQFMDYIKSKDLSNIITINELSTSYKKTGIHYEKPPS